jgi:F0F1-type ATP synthase membrane subunit a
LLGGMMFVIELLGFFIKHGVLAVRLFANIMGGHTVLGVILGFIAIAAAQSNVIYGMVHLEVFWSGVYWLPGIVCCVSAGLCVFVSCNDLYCGCDA